MKNKKESNVDSFFSWSGGVKDVILPPDHPLIRIGTVVNVILDDEWDLTQFEALDDRWLVLEKEADPKSFGEEGFLIIFDTDEEVISGKRKMVKLEPVECQASDRRGVPAGCQVKEIMSFIHLAEGVTHAVQRHTRGVDVVRQLPQEDGTLLFRQSERMPNRKVSMGIDFIVGDRGTETVVEQVNGTVTDVIQCIIEIKPDFQNNHLSYFFAEGND
jgi:hypothetical protein